MVGIVMTTTSATTPMKLVYFCARGRAEPVRLMLELVGAPYEYEGIPTAVWPTPDGKQRFLASTPLGQLPILQTATSPCASRRPFTSMWRARSASTERT